ncbi:TonB-dependent receptor [Sphingomonas suaedae]|uniref:TonB-dependent receptor n=1 Tax=Sphingomonas suaedae TaxID=2599297 RepID=A0A518RBC4_9SPHN|nr:TonB-dependent receptor [Sphingomonas suaedae]
MSVAGWFLLASQLGATPEANAQSTAPSQSAPGPDDSEVVIVATSGDQVLIDRNVYEIRDTPSTQTKAVIEILRMLPSVSVDAGGRLQLLGDNNVRVLVDGRPPPGGIGYIRTLQASQISRIEIITNPSAQFSSEGTAGVINIITRKSFGRGLKGATNVSGSSLGGYGARLSATWGDSLWSISGSLVASHGVEKASRSLERTPRDGVSGPAVDRAEIETTRYNQDLISARSSIQRKFGVGKSLTLAATISHTANNSAGRADISSNQNSFIPFVQFTSGAGTARSTQLDLTYSAAGREPGESLNVSISYGMNVLDAETIFQDRRLIDGRDFFRAQSASYRTGVAKVDYTRPVLSKGVLSAGAEASLNHGTMGAAAFGESFTAPARSVTSEVAADWSDVAGYLTYQHTLKKWKVLLGLRLQHRAYYFHAPQNGANGVFVAPSLHVEREIGSKISVRGSYTRRVDWPEYNYLSPAIQLSSSVTGRIGNPDLEPVITSAYELKASLTAGRQIIDVTGYSRQGSGVWSDISTLGADGIILSRRVNAGTQQRYGGEVSLRGPISKKLKYTVTIDAASESRERFDLNALVRRNAIFTYGSNIQIEYADKDSNRAGFDQISLGMSLVGPQGDLQSRADAFTSGYITWTRNISDRLSMTFHVNNPIGRSRYYLKSSSADYYERQYGSSFAPTFRLTIGYRIEPSKK